MFKKIFRLTLDGKTYKITIEEINAIQEVKDLEAIEEVEEVKEVKETIDVKHDTDNNNQMDFCYQCYMDENWLSENNKTIKAPMAGIISSVMIKTGAEIKAGDLIVVLEAMKMENELRAPRGGKVKEVLISQGQLVNQGETLIILE